MEKNNRMTAYVWAISGYGNVVCNLQVGRRPHGQDALEGMIQKRTTCNFSNRGMRTLHHNPGYNSQKTLNAKDAEGRSGVRSTHPACSGIRSPVHAVGSDPRCIQWDQIPGACSGIRSPVHAVGSDPRCKGKRNVSVTLRIVRDLIKIDI